MGCAPSAPNTAPPVNTPDPQRQGSSGVAIHLRELGLPQYADGFERLGYDDLDDLKAGFSHEELVDIAERVGMLEGHAGKLIKSLTGERPSPAVLRTLGTSRSTAQEDQHRAAQRGDADAQLEVTAPDEGARAVFWFIKAEAIRTCTDVVLPRHQDLRRQKPGWFVEMEVSLEGTCAHEYVGRILCVSHRWEEQGDPDTEGKQFAAIRSYLVERPKFEYVWYDFY